MVTGSHSKYCSHDSIYSHTLSLICLHPLTFSSGPQMDPWDHETPKLACRFSVCALIVLRGSLSELHSDSQRNSWPPPTYPVPPHPRKRRLGHGREDKRKWGTMAALKWTLKYHGANKRPRWKEVWGTQTSSAFSNTSYRFLQKSCLSFFPRHRHHSFPLNTVT